MITQPLHALGYEWYQAADIAALLGIPVDRVRGWGRRGLVDVHKVRGQGQGTAWFRLDQCAKRESLPRLLDAA